MAAFDARIALAGKPLQLADMARKGAVAGNLIATNIENRQTKPMRMRARELELKNAEADTKVNESKMQLRSAAIDTAPMLRLIEAGDFEGAAKLYRHRGSRLAAENRDPQHSFQWAEALESGDPDQINLVRDEMVGIQDAAVRFGDVNTVAAPKGWANMKPDAQGRMWGTDPADGTFKVMPSAVTGNFTTQNPVMEQIAALTAQYNLDEKRRQGKRDKAEEERRVEKASRERQSAEAASEVNERDIAKARGMTESLLTVTREILDDKDGIEAFSGYSAVIPTVKPKTRSFEAKVTRLRNALALENVDLLKPGTISDSDILVLQRSLDSIIEGGDTKENIREFQRISNILESALGMELTDYSEPDQAGGSGQMGRSQGTPKVKFLGFEGEK